MSQIALVHVTFPDAATAERIATQLVEEALAACANVMAACRSYYRWEGEVACDEEVPVLFKTSLTEADALRDRILSLHPYDLPVIECWPASVTDAMAQWADDAVGR